MKTEWFKDDRKLPKEEQPKAIEESKKALRAATLLRERLRSILEERVVKTYSDEEVIDPHYALKTAHNAGRRAALKEVLNLIDF